MKSKNSSYNIGEWGRARRDFTQVFKTGIAPFHDPLTTFYFKKIAIDIFKFDAYLKEKHADYDDSYSMNEFLLKEYGEEAVALIEKLL